MGSGWQVYVRPKSRKPVVRDEMYGRFPDAPHQQNFVDCVRTRQTPNADITPALMKKFDALAEKDTDAQCEHFMRSFIFALGSDWKKVVELCKKFKDLLQPSSFTATALD